MIESYLTATHLFLLIPAYLFLRLSYNLYINPLSKYPGPFLAKLTDFWRMGNVWFGRHEMPLVKLHEKYGDVVRIGPNVLTFGDPRAVKDIYLADGFSKSEYYSTADFYLRGVLQSTLFSTRDVAWHARLRRAFGPAFSMSNISHMENLVDNTIDLFISTLESRFADASGKAGELDLPAWLQYFSFDVLGFMMYGERHGFISKGGDVEDIIFISKVATQAGYILGQNPWTQYLLTKNPILVFLEKYGIVDSTFAVIPFALRHIKAREGRQMKLRDDGEVGEDLLDSLLHAKDKNPELLSDFEVVKMAAILVFAGSDTTAATISALLWYLTHNPSKLTKLRAEIDNRFTSTSASHISYSEAQALPYLDACVKEIFRIHPAVGFSGERVVPPGGAKIANHFIPGGTIVGVNAWVTHRNKAIFGEDVDTFRPERWLDNDTEKIKEMMRNMFHFSAGAHICIGRHMSLVEIYKLVPVFLRTFEIEMINATHDVMKTYNNAFVLPLDCKVRLKRRA